MMNAPRIKRVNTIGIRYIHGSIHEDDLPLIIDETLGIEDDDLEGISELGRNKLIVKLSDERVYRDICDKFNGVEVDVNDNIRIKVEDLSTYKTYVTIRNVPFEMSDFMLQDILSRYGSIAHIRKNIRNTGRYRNIPDGSRAVVIELSKPIPSFLYIESARVYISIYYRGQIKTCRLCGGDDHFANACNVRASQKSNVINDGDFPALNHRYKEDEAALPVAHASSDDQSKQSTLNPQEMQEPVIEVSL